ncbi:MAG TPA: translation initiation factor IF-2 [Candidatus Acidoferrales bacterium]|nr:translation initiation factor IF-2 [Candidatus Acidoferrales bacterium]
MTEHVQIRINELARELEVKAKAIIELLPGLGVAEKKTHSSSIDEYVAVKVRKILLGGEVEEAPAAPEAAAAVAVEEEKQEVVEAAPVPVVPPAPPVVPPPAPARVEIPAHPVARPAVAVIVPADQAPPPAPQPLIQRPVVVLAPPRPAAPPPPLPLRPPISSAPASPAPVRPQPRPSVFPGASAPGTARSSGQPLVQRPQAVRPPPPPLPLRPPITASAADRATGPMPQLPRKPPIPGTTGGAGARSGRPPRLTASPGVAMGVVAPGKPEVGKPLYQRKTTKPAAGARPTAEKRFEEGERKLHPVRARAGMPVRTERGGRSGIAEAPPPVHREPRPLTITEGISVRQLAEKLDVRAKELLATLLERGVFASINQPLDVQTATSLAEKFGGIVTVKSFEEEVVDEVSQEEKTKGAEPRAPVVTVMGHVDHGKTSLLDAIRQTSVAAGEAGGITQHIGAYEVHAGERKIVFIDTPGHEAFTRMRARGAKVTDVVVLVVGADDGVMPQTLEAISHAKSAGVPIVVAINKIDKPDAQPERVKRQLADQGLLAEEWGGDTVMVEVSAREKTNLDKLLEMILLVSDLRELKASSGVPASGTVLESRVDKGRGPVATVLVQNGTLHVGDFFFCGAVYGKVRAMFDDRANPIRAAGPSTPVEVLGLQGVPEAGDNFQVADEGKARHIVDYRQSKIREQTLARTATGRITLDQLHEQLKAGEVKELPIVVKADVQGSVEVLNEMLPKLSTDAVKIKILHSSVGAVTETDVLLASASNAIVIAFNVRPDRKAADLAQQENVEIRTHTVIYELTDELKKALVGLLEPVYKEKHLGRAEVRNTFRIKGIGMVAGCYVTDGTIRRDAELRLVRDGGIVFTGRVSSLRRFKDDASEVRTGFECGLGIANFNDVKVGDIVEFFTVEALEAAVATRA